MRAFHPFLDRQNMRLKAELIDDGDKDHVQPPPYLSQVACNR